MTTPPSPPFAGSEAERARTLCRLRELIVALDRRVPQVERAGEASIANSGSELYAAALRKIRELERCAPAADRPDKPR